MNSDASSEHSNDSKSSRDEKEENFEKSDTSSSASKQNEDEREPQPVQEEEEKTETKNENQNFSQQQKPKITLNTTIKKFIASENIDLSITCSSYAEINLQPEKIQGFLQSDSNHGLTGLKNLGNISYMSSIIQCLSHNPDLVYYYISDTYKNDINKSNPKSGAFSKAFSALLKKLWIENNKIVSPQEFRYAIIDNCREFYNNNQHDGSEFLIKILDILHNDIRKEPPRSHRYVEYPQNENETTIAASMRFWKFFKMNNNSMISNLFYGQIKNSLRCLGCAYTQTTFEVFSLLPLEIPNLVKVNVLLVPSSNVKSTIEFSLFVSDAALFVDLGVYLKQYLSENTFENFRILLYNINTQSVKFVKMSENIFNVSKKGVIVVYEIGDSVYNEDEGEEQENEDYYPFITVIRGDSPVNTSYPRVFPINSFSKVKSLRVKLYGLIRKYYTYQGFTEKEEDKKNDFEETELLRLYTKEYNYLFGGKPIEDKSEKEKIDKYIKEMPFKCFLSSHKPGKEDINIFGNFGESGEKKENNDIPDSSPIQKIIDYAKSGYKLVIQVSDQETLAKMNKIVSITSDETTKTPSLSDCLIHFSLNEKLDKSNEWFCPRCHKTQSAYKKIELFYLPKYLTLLLSRYQKNLLSKTKIQLLKKNDQVNFGTDGVNFDRFVTGIKIPKNIYDLYAVSQQSGSIEGGRYFSACKNFGKWYMFDDASVFKCDDDMISTPEGYILFYRKVKENKKN